jgi:hypothetical protein
MIYISTFYMTVCHNIYSAVWLCSVVYYVQCLALPSATVCTLMRSYFVSCICVLPSCFFDLRAYLTGNQCDLLVHTKGFIYREMNILAVGVIL